MYNIYNHEKKLSELKQKLHESEKEEHLKEKRKSLFNYLHKDQKSELANRYEHRIRDFVYDVS